MNPMSSSIAKKRPLDETQPEGQQTIVRDATPVRTIALPNIRTWRLATRPWNVESGELSATIKQTNVQQDVPRKNTWGLGIELNVPNQWRLLSVSSSTRDARVTAIRPDAVATAGSRQIEVRVSADGFAPKGKDRVPVTLAIEYECGGKVTRRQIDVDYSYLVGDTLFFNNAAGTVSQQAARLVKRNLDDPLIERLIKRARAFPVGTVEEEMKRLTRWLDYDFQYDPNMALANRSNEGEDYVLSPTETARYGGDCEDWNMLAGAYLVRRGFRFAVAYMFGHVHGIAIDKDGQEVAVDYVNFDSESKVVMPRGDYDKKYGKPLEIGWVETGKRKGEERPGSQ